MRTSSFALPFIIAVAAACQSNNHRSDAYGNFEAREIIISAETGGKILFLDAEEGQPLKAGQLVGLIDTTTLHFQREQLLATIGAVRRKTQDARPQVEVLQEQKENLLREKKRTEALLAEKAATPKQLDDIEGQIEVIDQQIAATLAQEKTANRGILAEVDPLLAQINLIEDQLQKCYVINPIEGIVLVKLAEPAEMAVPGKALYKIADLTEMELRVYVSGAQLPHIRLGEEVTVLIDENEDKTRSLKGRISWIAGQAEFTPKIVQTKEERVNLVYAVKVKVANQDGRLKIGMPGEVNFNIPEEAAGSDEAAKTATN